MTATSRGGLARLKGLEPLTHCLEGSCSIQLSYRRVWNAARPPAGAGSRLPGPLRSSSPICKTDRQAIGFANGAGDGNRTHATSLEGWDSTIELHPHNLDKYEIISRDFSLFCLPLSATLLLYHAYTHLSSFFSKNILFNLEFTYRPK